MRPRHKFGNKPVVRDGHRYASQAEARFAALLGERKARGEVVMWLEQVPVRLPGRTKWVADFVVFEASGETRFIDVKGVETDAFKIKRREIEALYPFKIEVVKMPRESRRKRAP